MKKLAIALLAIAPFICSAKQPTKDDQIALLKAQNATLKAEIVAKDSIVNNIPDTFCITALDSTFCVPTKDAQEIAIPIVDYAKKTDHNGWPRTAKEWILWIIGLFPLIFGARKLTAINNIWKILQPYLKSRLGLAVLAGGALSALVTLLVSFVTKDFNMTMLMVIWPWASLGASYIHNIKAKKNAVPA